MLKQLKTGSIEEIDAFLDALIRKPRGREIVVMAIPVGEQLLSVEAPGTSKFLTFFTLAGTLQSLLVKFPPNTKNASLSLELVTATGTNVVLITGAEQTIQVEAGTKVTIQVIADNPIPEVLFGGVFIPRVT